jgi:hypothetical protein
MYLAQKPEKVNSLTLRVITLFFNEADLFLLPDLQAILSERSSIYKFCRVDFDSRAWRTFEK